MRDRLKIDDMCETVAEWLAQGPDVTEADRLRAREVLEAIGVPLLLEELEIAERVITFGNCFHSVAGFFADDTREQRYVRDLTDGGEA